MSEYPERPVGGRRPARPGKSRNRSSSQNGGKKSRTWLQLASAPVDKTGERLKDMHLDLSLCVIGHSGVARKAA